MTEERDVLDYMPESYLLNFLDASDYHNMNLVSLNRDHPDYTIQLEEEQINQNRKIMLEFAKDKILGMRKKNEEISDEH